MEELGFNVEVVLLSSLSPHPRNYRIHPDNQISHIVESIRANGIYHNVVVARDNTLLAGHGVVEALRRMGEERVPVIRLDCDSGDVRALKVLAGDNEIEHLAEQNDRELADMLKEIKNADESSLLGTDYDEMMLVNLVYVTRPASEIADFNAAAEWVGMPEFEPVLPPLKIIVNFRSNDDRREFARVLGLKSMNFEHPHLSVWWPPKQKDDMISVRFETEEASAS